MLKKAKKNNKETVQFSVTVSNDTAQMINEMLTLPQYRRNRSLVIETLITSNPTYISFSKDKK